MMAMPDPRPNLLYLDAHDVGDWIGCLRAPWLRTHWLDWLAAGGVAMANHFATAPVCMPSRASMATGRYPHQVGVVGQNPLREDAVHVVERFREAGYRTVLAGGLKIANTPEWAGFERRIGAGGGDEGAVEAACDWLGSMDTVGGAGAGRPWLLWLSFNAVHRPFGETWDANIAAALDVPASLPDVPAVRADLAALSHRVEHLDSLVGRLFGALIEHDLERDTLVVFTTDHGIATAGHKHTLHDGGLRCALLMRLPGVIEAERVEGALTTHLDLSPTLLELCGIEPPGEGVGVEGRSFAAGLREGCAVQPRDAVFSEHNWGRRSGRWHYSPARSVRTGRYRYTRRYTARPDFVDTGLLARFRGRLDDLVPHVNRAEPMETLHDLQEDPHELVNLLDGPADDAVRAVGAVGAMAQSMRRLLDDHLRATDDPILYGPVDNGVGEPDLPQWVGRVGAGETWRLAGDEVLDAGKASLTEPLGER